MIKDLSNPLVLSLHYFGNLAYYGVLLKGSPVLLDLKENYTKQTYRSRCTILGSNGPLNLVIPKVKESGLRQKMEEIKISYEENWQDIHWRSITAAYRSSPYFEYYETQFEEIYTKKPTLLSEFCLAGHQLVYKILGIKEPIAFTKTYYVAQENEKDYRNILSPKNKIVPPALINNSYIQVFSDRFPFCPNLSILDLIFNEGPNAASYLQQIGKDL